MMLYYQTKFGCKPTSSLDGTGHQEDPRPIKAVHHRTAPMGAQPGTSGTRQRY